MAQVRFDTTVCNGFPIEVVVDFEGHRRAASIYDLTILTRQGKPARFIERKMTALDRAAIQERAFEAHAEQCFYGSYDG